MSRINRLPVSPPASATMALLLVMVAAYVFAYDRTFGWIPSLFENRLPDTGYLYRGRWLAPSTTDIFGGAAILYILWYFVSQTIDGVYNFVRKNPWFPLLLPLIVLVLVIGRDVYAGFAVYGDRIAMRSPMSTQAVKTYSVTDIVRIEVGCRDGSSRRGFHQRPLRPVPLYTIFFRDGASLSPFELAADETDPRLMAAMLRFDRAVQAADVPRTLWDMNLASRKLNERQCFDAMEGNYDPALQPAIRRTFLSDEAVEP